MRGLTITAHSTEVRHTVVTGWICRLERGQQAVRRSSVDIDLDQVCPKIFLEPDQVQQMFIQRSQAIAATRLSVLLKSWS
jgi:hypothetical protein